MDGNCSHTILHAVQNPPAFKVAKAVGPNLDREFNRFDFSGRTQNVLSLPSMNSASAAVRKLAASGVGDR